MAINYPAIPRGVDVGAILDQTRQGWQDGRTAKAEADAPAQLLSSFQQQLRSLQQPNPPSQGQFLANQAANNGQVQRADLPPVNDPNTAHVQQAFTSQGPGSSANTLTGNQIAGRFIKTVRDGGVTNPFALAAIAATGKAESGFDPKNAFSTWSDPSQSGDAGTAGGIMSWRGPRLQAMQAFAQQNGDNPNAPSPETQAKFLVQEDPSLMQKLQAAQSPQEAAQIMAQAWKFAGFDQPGGEAASRSAATLAYAPQFGAGQSQGGALGAPPSQQALEGLTVGQSAPMPQSAAQQSYGGDGSMAQASFQAQQAPDGSLGPGMPDPATLKALFANPLTRPYAINMAQSRIAAMQDQRDPMKQLAYQKSLIELQNLQANGGQPIPTGYRKTANGLEAIPGGPYDPANPLNNRKINGSSSGAETDGNAQAIADAIKRGDQPPTMTGLYKYSGPVRAALAKSGYDLSTANEDWTATQKHLASLNGPQQLRLRQAVDFAASSTDLVDQLATEWKGGQYPLLNAANLIAAKNGAYGQQAASLATRLSASIADLTSELGTVYKGGNGSTDETLRLASQNLNENWSTDTIKDATDQIRKTLVYRQNSLKHVGVSGISNSQYDPNRNEDQPSQTAAPRVDAPAPSGRPSATNPQTGQKMEWDGQNWSPVQ